MPSTTEVRILSTEPSHEASPCFLHQDQLAAITTIGERYVNNHSPARPLAEPRPIRDIIIDARKTSGRTEKQVNREYRRHMQEAGFEAPKSIMTKVRDKRRAFTLTTKEARCLAAALDIDPVILTPATAESKPSAPSASSRRPERAPGDGSNPSEEERPTGTDDELVLAPRSYGAAGVRFSEKPDGLQFTIDMDLDHVQFDRLTLAIPTYMMRYQRAGRMIRCRASVPIFPYQAELIMRAIYGGR